MPGQANDALLHAGQFGVAHFHTEVPAGNHDDVGGCDDFVDAIQSLDSFNLGDDLSGPTGGLEKRARLLNVGSTAHERHGEKIHTRLGREANVIPVFFGQRWRRQSATLAINALMIRQHAADDYRRMDTRAINFSRLQSYLSIVEQQDIVFFEILVQIAISDADTVPVSGVVSQGRIQEKIVAFGQRDAAVFESSDADLGALQIADDANKPAALGSDFPK